MANSYLQPPPLSDQSFSSNWINWFNVFYEVYSELNNQVSTLNGVVTSNGIIFPSLSQDEIDALIDDLAPVAGQTLRNSTVNKLQYFNGTSWETITSA